MTCWFEWQSAPHSQFAVIGDPISHSLSPAIHAAAYRELGLDLRYEAIRVPLTEFDLALGHLADSGYRGLNVTVPLKRAAANFTPNPEPVVVQCASANTLDLPGSRATSTDGAGFLETLAQLEIAPSRALVLGAGGSASVVVQALVDTGWEVRVHNRTESGANALCERLGCQFSSSPDPAGCALIINATSAGLHGGSPKVHWEVADPDAFAYDLSYSTEPTPFLRDAAVSGVRGTDGKEMLLAQACLSLEWWLGRPAPRQAMRHALYEALETNR